MRIVTALLAGTAALGLAAGPALGDVTLSQVDWETIGMEVEFHLQFHNPDPQAFSGEVSGSISSQPYGAFLEDYGPIGTFDIPPIPPESFFDVYFVTPLDMLPPSALEFLPGGGPELLRNTCPPDTSWDGNVDVIWAGPGGAGQVLPHLGTMLVNIGDGPSFIHVTMNCVTPPGITWGFAGVCPGWTASLLQSNNMGMPGGAAPALIPPGLFDGWIRLTAGNSVADGDTCCVALNLSCGVAPPVPAQIQLCGIACVWGPISVEPQSWGRIKSLYR